MVMGAILFGTCSWKYPSWLDLVYSQTDPDSYLAEYAQQYEMVEIDQWFWSLGRQSAGLPKQDTVVRYDAATPETFKFTIKCPNALTRPFHDSDPQGTMHPNEFFLDPSLMHAFIASLEPIRSKIGLLMFQFGYLNKRSMESQVLFMDRLDRFFQELPQGLPYAIELRNPAWLHGDWFTWLTDRHIAPVLIQGYWMDDISQTIERYEQLFGETVSIRLHGEDREEMEIDSGGQWNRIINPRDRELAKIALSITTMAERGRTVFVQVNNHYEGSAPLTIERLRAVMR